LSASSTPFADAFSAARASFSCRVSPSVSALSLYPEHRTWLEAQGFGVVDEDLR
jgi:hypothetical protein